jgi:4-carboxymuconolactone decarboxylase
MRKWIVTLGMLIALSATDELAIHFKIARTNGLTDDEIGEAIFHSSGYAGFPAAATACRIAEEALSDGAT